MHRAAAPHPDMSSVDIAPERPAAAPTGSGSFVRADRVRTVFGQGADAVVALDQVSLRAHGSQFVSIVGPSGCGKSTLLRAVAGLQPIQGGTITIGGQPVAGPYL